MYVLIIFHTSIPEKHVLVSELEILQPEQGVFFRFIKNGPSGTFFLYPKTISSWWFQRFFIFTHIWGRFPFWLIFFKWVETTNQICLCKHIVVHKDLVIFVPIGYLSSSKMALLQPPQGWGPLIINPIYTLYSGYIYIYCIYIYTQFFQIFVILQVWFPKQTFVKFEFTPETRNPSPWPMAIFHLHGHRCFKDGFPLSTVGFEPSFPRIVQVTGALLFIVMVLPSQYRLSWRDGSRDVVFLFFVSFLQTFLSAPKLQVVLGPEKALVV